MEYTVVYGGISCVRNGRPVCPINIELLEVECLARYVYVCMHALHVDIKEDEVK